MILATAISKLVVADLVQLARFGSDKLFIDYDEEEDKIPYCFIEIN